MPSYAVLGATGNTGLQLVNIIAKSPDKTIHAYCRSKSKLQKLAPDVASSPQLKVFEGQLSEVDVIADCIRNTRAIFLTVAVNDNIPGLTIAIDTAHVVIEALEKNRKEAPNAPVPKVVVLSSASTNKQFIETVGKIAATVAHTAFSNIYADLERAEAFLRSHDWLSVSFIKPGVLAQDIQRGHELSTTKSESPISYADVAAGMIEVADSGDEYIGKDVSPNPKVKNLPFPKEAPVYMFWGLLFHFFPWLWKYLGK